MTTTVIALGGNALLRRGDPMDPAIQDRNVAEAAAAIIAAVPDGERVVVTHGNGPQVGLLALADAGRPGGIPFPLDVLDAESEGMIGYLLARHLHRIGGRQVATLLTQVVVDVDDEASDDVLEVGDVTLDPSRHEVVIRGDDVSLPLKEFELLHLLLENAGRVLSRDLLIDRVWGHDYVGDTKTLDVHVKRLRAKVEADPANPSRIVTIRGLGYKYETPKLSRV